MLMIRAIIACNVGHTVVMEQYSQFCCSSVLLRTVINNERTTPMWEFRNADKISVLYNRDC